MMNVAPSPQSLKPRIATLESAVGGDIGVGMGPALAPRVAALEQAVGGEAARAEATDGNTGLAPRVFGLETQVKDMRLLLDRLERDTSGTATPPARSESSGICTRLAEIEVEVGVTGPSCDVSTRADRAVSVAADAMARIVAMETIIHGADNSGSEGLKPRLAGLEKAVCGVAASGAVMPRILALEREVQGRAWSKGVADRLIALEENVMGQAESGPLHQRMTALEMEVCGRSTATDSGGSGAQDLLQRLASMEVDVYGGSSYLNATIGANMAMGKPLLSIGASNASVASAIMSPSKTAGGDGDGDRLPLSMPRARAGGNVGKRP